MLRRFGWPPDVTRRQTHRDLLLLTDAADAGAFERNDDGDL